MESLDGVWEAMDMSSSSATKRYNLPVDLENSPHQPFTQEGLVAYVYVIQSTRKTSWAMDGKEWDLKRLTRSISRGGYCCFDSFKPILFITRILAVLTTGHLSTSSPPFRSELDFSRSTILRSY